MIPHPEKSPQWWDREIDDLGVPIRDDVRQAVPFIWPDAHSRARAVLGDASEAAELMEATIVHISRHLNRNGNAADAKDIRSLLMLHFCQELRRRAGKLGRTRFVGTVTDIGEIATVPNWVEDVDRRIDFERLLPHLERRSCTIIRMRAMECSWKEIGKKLGIAPSTARSAFWQDLHRAQSGIESKKLRPGESNLSGRYEP
jgi:DNA-directed RNA polymerase specialized sigma24 family protein